MRKRSEDRRFEKESSSFVVKKVIYKMSWSFSLALKRLVGSGVLVYYSSGGEEKEEF